MLGGACILMRGVDNNHEKWVNYTACYKLKTTVEKIEQGKKVDQ